MGFQPAKSWTANKVLAAIQTSTLPRGKAGSGDTVAELRAYAKANGLRGYSRMLKAELFALVSDHKAGIIGKEAA